MHSEPGNPPDPHPLLPSLGAPHVHRGRRAPEPFTAIECDVRGTVAGDTAKHLGAARCVRAGKKVWHRVAAPLSEVVQILLPGILGVNQVRRV